jgi:hypothetical protein
LDETELETVNTSAPARYAQPAPYVEVPQLKASFVGEEDFDNAPFLPDVTTAVTLTEKQLKAIYAIGRAAKRLSEQQVDDRSAEVFGVRPNELTKAEASQFIDMLKGEAA